MGLRLEDLNERIIGLAVEVSRSLGPGLLESAHEESLCHELDSTAFDTLRPRACRGELVAGRLRGLAFEKRASLPVADKGTKLDCGYRPDTEVLAEAECVNELLAVQDAQLPKYPRLAGP